MQPVSLRSMSLTPLMEGADGVGVTLEGGVGELGEGTVGEIAVVDWRGQRLDLRVLLRVMSPSRAAALSVGQPLPHLGIKDTAMLNNKSYEEEGADEDIDFEALRQGYISVTPMDALFHRDTDAVPYFKNCLNRVVDYSPSSSL